MRRVIIMEDINSRDMVVLENEVSIPAQFRQDSRVLADFGMLTFQKQQPPCRWKKMRDISASRLSRVGDGGVLLIQIWRLEDLQ